MVSAFAIIAALVNAIATLTSSRVVRTKYGDVTGVIVTPEARHLDSVEIFRGIPYAAPPVGGLRFMPPVTGAMWTGVKLADKFGPVCPQRFPDISDEAEFQRRMPSGRLQYLKRLMPHLQNQSEDCLYLNIYVPAQVGESSKKYPVMVLIHGESYEWNSGNLYDGTILASFGGLLVVTINYRLGILGFLNTNTDPNFKSPSNYGLMDQIAALHWLRENISEFGGDESNVTLLGHGTGAACVNFLMLSSAVPDGLLFHRAVLMSGSALSPWALVPDPMHYTREVARWVNCSTDQSQMGLLKCLRSVPLEALLDTPMKAEEFVFAVGPSVDGVVVDSTLADFRFVNMEDDLRKIIEAYKGDSGGGGGGSVESGSGGSSLFLKMVSKLSRYDLLLGLVPAESFFSFNADDVQYGIETDRRSRILKSFIGNAFKYHLNEILATIVNEYTDWERPVLHPVTIRDGTLEALSDAQYAAPILQIADLHSSARRNSYLYVFDYETKFGDYPQRQGCIHGEEIPYILGAPLVGGFAHFSRNYTKTEMLLSEATISYWSNFARTGNPNSSPDQEISHGGGRQERNRFKNIEWTAYENIHKKYLSLDIKSKLKNHYRSHKLSFWMNLVPELHKSGAEELSAFHHTFHGVRYPIFFSNANASVPNVTMQPTTFGYEIIDGGNDIGGGGGRDGGMDRYAKFWEQSTPLIATIVVGSTFLFLNIVVFVAIYRKTTRREDDRDDSADRRRRRKKMQQQHLHQRCDSSNSSLGDAPDICGGGYSKGNGDIRQTMNYGYRPEMVSQKCTTLPSILKKRNHANNNKTDLSGVSDLHHQPSVMIITPPRDFREEGGGVELSCGNKYGTRNCSTLPRPPPRSDVESQGCSLMTFQGGTCCEYGDMRV